MGEARAGPILDATRSDPRAGGPSFSLRNRLLRAAWNLTWLLLASWTPRQLHPWRRFLLRAFGASMAGNADVRGSARVWFPPHLVMEDGALIGPRVNCYNMATVSLGAGALVSQGAHLCAGSHDIDSPVFQLVARPISLGPEVWVAAEAFVGPGVRIREGAVLGARAAAFRDLEPWTVYGGNPAVALRQRRIRDGG
jgi:putative colanic acid biosynthesis acetyltransferase WcaF